VADRTSTSRLNEAVADDSLDGPRHRAADWDESFDLDEEPGPISGARRSKLSTVSADGSGPTPVEEMDDVSEGLDKEAAAVESDAKATSTPATASGTAEPAAESSAAADSGTVATASRNDAGQDSGESATRPGKDAEAKPTLMTPAEKAGAGKTGAAKPAAAKPAAAKPAAAKPAAKATAPGGKQVGKSGTALSAVGTGVTRLRNLIAQVVWLAAVLCAAVLALGALFTALSQTNESNEIVRWVLDRGHDLVGPFGDLFKLETAKNTLLVNWGIAALAYLAVGKVIERIIRH
jgi:hypothetical protein